ncbi:MAG: trxA [Bacteroidetes bacterium]|jgi:thioredoxin 1|nr:trxA [Bacteroidota bacterium]
MADFNSIINSGKPVLVDFFAEWCGPCKTMAPILKEVKEKVGDAATIIKVDIDRNQAAASAYHVRSVPTLILFKNGTVIWKRSGVIQASELIELLSA